MMDKQNVNGFHPRASVNGHQRRQLPYSVETPYGFRLDLDFLKYVDDIEKGNTIRRVHIQRRNRGPKFSALHRNFSLPGCSYRAPWASTPALGPNGKSQLMETQQVLEFGACEDGPSGVSVSPNVNYVTLRTMEEASIRAFDEQAPGVHVRPYLLRATSMPVTTLQRTTSEASDDRAATASGGLCSENGSSEDVFGERRGGSPSSDPGLRLQLATALQRIGELEEQARTVRELKDQITTLREDKEHLLLQLHSCPTTVLVQKTECEQLEHQNPMSRPNGSDLNSCSITALQMRITELEQKLSRTNAELDESSFHLKELRLENKLKEDQIKQLADRGCVDLGANQDQVPSGSGALQRDWTSSSTQTDAAATLGSDLLEPLRSSNTVGNPVDEVLPGSPETLEPNRPATNATVGLYITRIESLLQEQWECMSREDPDNTLQQPGSKISSIQAELLGSIQTLSTMCASLAQTTGVAHQAALKSIMKKSASTEGLGAGTAKKNLKFVGVNGGYETTSSEESSSEESMEEQKCESREEGDPTGGAGESDLGPDSPEAPEPCEGPHEDRPSREPVEDFTAVCCYLNDHLEDVDCPNEKMREVLTVLYQMWFHVSSQKDSTAKKVALYLKQAQSFGPTILRFLVNLADGNDNMALHYSVSHSNFAIAKLLLSTGLCDVNHRNKAGYTVIMLASLTAADAPEDMEVARQLMEQADINVRSSQAGQTALMLAVSHGRTPMVRLLLAGRADVNLQDQRGATPLMCACEYGHTEIARLLLEHGACDTSLTDNEGRTALSVALSSSHSEIADLLHAYDDARSSGRARPQ